MDSIKDKDAHSKKIYGQFSATLLDNIRNVCALDIIYDDFIKIKFLFGDRIGKGFATDERSYFKTENILEEVGNKIITAMNSFIAEKLETNIRNRTNRFGRARIF